MTQNWFIKAKDRVEEARITFHPMWPKDRVNQSHPSKLPVYPTKDVYKAKLVTIAGKKRP